MPVVRCAVSRTSHEKTGQSDTCMPSFPIVSDIGHYLLCFMHPRNVWPGDSRCGPQVVSLLETQLALKAIIQHIPIFGRHHWSLPSANGLGLTQACNHSPQDIDEQRPDPLPSKYQGPKDQQAKPWSTDDLLHAGSHQTSRPTGQARTIFDQSNAMQGEAQQPPCVACEHLM